VRHAPSRWIPRDRPLVFAHRGGSRLAPENTIAAFDRGLAEGADGLEFDTRLSADGVPVVIHDDTLDRTTGGSGPVSVRTARDLAAVDAGHHFDPDAGFPWRGRGVGVPTLRELLDRYRDCPLIVELKEDGRELADSVLAEIRRVGADDRVCIGSFHWRVLRYVRRVAPRLATSASGLDIRVSMWLSRHGLPLWRPPFDVYQVPEVRHGLTIVTESFIRMARRAGVPVQVWIVDHAEDIRRLLDWGVEGILTDRPDVAVREVRAFRRS